MKPISMQDLAKLDSQALSGLLMMAIEECGNRIDTCYQDGDWDELNVWTHTIPTFEEALADLRTKQ